MDEEFKELAKWTGIIGIITIIAGIIQTITGLFAFIIGAIPGIISIILGTKLLNVKKYADEVVSFKIDEPSIQIRYILSNLSSYFKIQGILLIISLIMPIISKSLK